MFRLNDVVSSESSADSDDSDDNVDGGASSQIVTETQMHMTATTRSKREILWCGVEDDAPGTSAPLASSSQRSEQRPRSPRRPSLDPYTGIPLSVYHNGVPLQLYCQSQQLLAVYPDGKIRGTGDPNDPHTRLEMIPTGFPGHVVIKGLLSNLYVSMNNKGRLRAQGNRDAEMSVFIEGTIGFYMYYLSRHFAHNGWYLGLKKSGKFKNGQKTKLNQKAVRWLKLYPK